MTDKETLKITVYKDKRSGKLIATSEHLGNVNYKIIDTLTWVQK